MIKNSIRKILRNWGYEIRRIEPPFSPGPENAHAAPAPMVNPVWPLPRKADGPSDEQVRKEFTRFAYWHYAYQFEGGLSFSSRHNNPGPNTDKPKRPLQRFRHFMPDLIAAQGGSLRGKRVLDCACNSGFWSIQCALLGADVVGFDARDELIEQANLIKDITGAENVEFRELDFWDMSPETLGGTFDVVLSLGILYHLPKPLEALELIKSMARENILLDTTVHPGNAPLVKMHWEEADDIRNAFKPGVVASPSKSSIELMLRHIGVSRWFEIPIRGEDMPRDYLRHIRASWLITC